MGIFLAVLAVLASAYVFFGWYFSSVLLFPKTVDYEQAIAEDRERGKLDSGYLDVFQKMDRQELRIQSHGGYELHGYWIPNGQSKKTVIFCHGITWNLVGSIKYSEIFYSMGFNLLLYDHRNHGKSGGDRTTFGYYEKEDLKCWVDWVVAHIGQEAVVGTHGESLGAATVLQHLGIDDRIRFCIADCPYSDLSEVLKYRLSVDYKITHLPMVPVTSFFTKWRAGMHIREVSPIQVVKNVETPILFIHGEEDKYVPPAMSKALYEAKQRGFKRLWIVPGARHAASYSKNKQAYREVVQSFLEAIEK